MEYELGKMLEELILRIQKLDEKIEILLNEVKRK
jgi:hypothetical protein